MTHTYLHTKSSETTEEDVRLCHPVHGTIPQHITLTTVQSEHKVEYMHALMDTYKGSHLFQLSQPPG